jgi:hypothetical protein
VICGEGGLREGLGGFGINSRLLGDVELSLGKWKKGMEKEVCILLCDFNGRWLKDSSFLCSINILLSVKGRIV